ncbi:hypothetical protein HanHA300_Chr07g0233571 [Helianthus annuus]|nr:hypothetical protein HanHA300_Chr07g0233571 [Helianthus annuus]
MALSYHKAQTHNPYRPIPFLFPLLASPDDRIGIGETMGYVLRVRFASFFAGAAVALAAGSYYLHKDYKIAHQAMSQQVFSSPFSFTFFYQSIRLQPVIAPRLCCGFCLNFAEYVRVL